MQEWAVPKSFENEFTSFLGLIENINWSEVKVSSIVVDQIIDSYPWNQLLIGSEGASGVPAFERKFNYGLRPESWGQNSINRLN